MHEHLEAKTELKGKYWPPSRWQENKRIKANVDKRKVIANRHIVPD